MVFVDLDDAFDAEKPFQLMVDPISEPAELPSPPSSEESEVTNPNRNAFSAALSCYPYVSADCGALAPTTTKPN